jgi:eukaryotic-like serine/threonine-protein kinase
VTDTPVTQPVTGPGELRDDDPLERRLGSVVAGARLEQLLGAGGMAAVYLVRGADGSERAMKILHPRVAHDAGLSARFRQEVAAILRLRHPAIVRIDDTGTTHDGCPFVLMERLQGETLAQRVKRQPMSLPEALGLADDLLDALSLAHRERIVHRDIKPDNVFLLAGGGIKVLDFGIAKVRRESMAQIVTETGVALGTPAYMAQEQIKGIDVDHRADLFAVGAVLFEILAGRRIHQEPSTHQLLVKMLTTPAPPLLSVAPQVPAAVAAVVDRALRFEPQDRYPNAITMQADVRALRSGRPPTFASPPAPAAAPAAETAKAQPSWLLPAVVAACVLLGVAIALVLAL